MLEIPPHPRPAHLPRARRKPRAARQRLHRDLSQAARDAQPHRPAWWWRRLRLASSLRLRLRRPGLQIHERDAPQRAGGVGGVGGEEVVVVVAVATAAAAAAAATAVGDVEGLDVDVGVGGGDEVGGEELGVVGGEDAGWGGVDVGGLEEGLGGAAEELHVDAGNSLGGG